MVIGRSITNFMVVYDEYGPKSLKFVEALVKYMENGSDVSKELRGYYAERDMPPGRNLFRENFHRFSISQFIIVVLTEDFLKRGWCRYLQHSSFKALLEDPNRGSERVLNVALNLDHKYLQEKCQLLRHHNVTYFCDFCIEEVHLYYKFNKILCTLKNPVSFRQRMEESRYSLGDGNLEATSAEERYDSENLTRSEQVTCRCQSKELCDEADNDSNAGFDVVDSAPEHPGVTSNYHGSSHQSTGNSGKTMDINSSIAESDSVRPSSLCLIRQGSLESSHDDNLKNQHPFVNNCRSLVPEASKLYDPFVLNAKRNESSIEDDRSNRNQTVKKEVKFMVLYNEHDKSLEVVKKLVDYLESRSCTQFEIRGYFGERDMPPGRNLFNENFRVINSVEFVIVVLTREFMASGWNEYLQEAAFNELIEDERKGPDRLIPLAFNVTIGELRAQNQLTNIHHAISLFDVETEGKHSDKIAFEKILQILKCPTNGYPSCNVLVATELMPLSLSVTPPAIEIIPRSVTDSADLTPPATNMPLSVSAQVTTPSTYVMPSSMLDLAEVTPPPTILARMNNSAGMESTLWSNDYTTDAENSIDDVDLAFGEATNVHSQASFEQPSSALRSWSTSSWMLESGAYLERIKRSISELSPASWFRTGSFISNEDEQIDRHETTESLSFEFDDSQTSELMENIHLDGP